MHVVTQCHVSKGMVPASPSQSLGPLPRGLPCRSGSDLGFGPGPHARQSGPRSHTTPWGYVHTCFSDRPALGPKRKGSVTLTLLCTPATALTSRTNQLQNRDVLKKQLKKQKKPQQWTAASGPKQGARKPPLDPLRERAGQTEQSTALPGPTNGGEQGAGCSLGCRKTKDDRAHGSRSRDTCVDPPRGPAPTRKP